MTHLYKTNSYKLKNKLQDIIWNFSIRAPARTGLSARIYCTGGGKNIQCFIFKQNLFYSAGLVTSGGLGLEFPVCLPAAGRGNQAARLRLCSRLLIRKIPKWTRKIKS